MVTFPLRFITFARFSKRWLEGETISQECAGCLDQLVLRAYNKRFRLHLFWFRQSLIFFIPGLLNRAVFSGFRAEKLISFCAVFLWAVISSSAFSSEKNNAKDFMVSKGANGSVFLKELSSILVPGAPSNGSAEIVAVDVKLARLFVVNADPGRIEVYEMVPRSGHALSLVHVDSLSVKKDLADYLSIGDERSVFQGLTSVDVLSQRDLLATSMALAKPDNGYVAFYRISDGSFVGAVRVGPLPDMLTFTPDGKSLIVANEGEPMVDYQKDPPGSLSIIKLTRGSRVPSQADVKTLSLLDGIDRKLLNRIRVTGPSRDIALDLEPEYVTVTHDGSQAFVSLQENNAIATIDLESMVVEGIWSLGRKDHSKPGYGLDPSDKDGGINIQSWPVYSLYMPDGIASYSFAGRTFLVTANEGDVRQYGSETDAIKVSDLSCRLAGVYKGGKFPDINKDGRSDYKDIKSHLGLGSLEVTRPDKGKDQFCGDLLAFGARSFSIWDAANRSLVFDSGDKFETITADLEPDHFNHGDKRSDNRGPEPESVTLGRSGEKIFAFIGLERANGIVVYEITNPYKPRFISYNSSLDSVGAGAYSYKHRGPESIEFISRKDSPIDANILVVSYEYSGTVVVYEIVGLPQ